MASSAWHIDQMGQPPRLDVWACAQSNVQWWMSIRSAGGACSFGFLVDISLQQGGVGWLGESVTSRHHGPSSSACGSYSAAAGRSDGYKQGSAFFVMMPFRHNVFSRMFSDGCGGPHPNCGETTRRIRTVCRSKLVEKPRPIKYLLPSAAALGWSI